MGCDCFDVCMPANFGEVIKVPVKVGADDITAITETPDPHGGTVLEITSLDLSHDTVSPDSLLSGYTAHDSSGHLIVGDAKSAITVSETPDPHGGVILEITGVDISHDTVTPKGLIRGYTAHDRHGNLITGEARRGTCGFDVEVCFGEVIRVPITDYAKLINKPTIEGVVINGDLELSDFGITNIYCETTEYWNSQEELIGKAGAIYIYSDAYVKYDDQGNPINIASIKIGDGITRLSDTQFVGSSVSTEIENHIADETVHISEADRQFWDNKVSMYIDPENTERLIFTNGVVPDLPPVVPDEDDPTIGELIQIEQISDDVNDGYNITWQQAKEAINNGDILFLTLQNDDAYSVYESKSATFDFSIRKYVLAMTNITNEFDRIVIFADSQTGNLHP